jgi:transcriptional regulator with XRE-family HTH domain
MDQPDVESLDRCADCGRELTEEPVEDAPTRCEDCRSEIGPGSPYAGQLSFNLRRLRERAHLSEAVLGRRSGMHVDRIIELENDGARDLSLTTVLKLLPPLGASIEEFTERIFWNPGQITRGSSKPQGERLTGFFLVLPVNVPIYEKASPREPVTTRQEAASIIGANLRSARERRHLSQLALGRRAGLSKAGLSLIERGVRETSIQALVALARSLEVPLEILFDGIAWKPEQRPLGESRARRRANSLDASICRLWNEDKTAQEIADTLGTSCGTVSATVHRLRERGAHLRYRRSPTRTVHERARERRAPCQARPSGQADLATGTPEPPARFRSASKQEIASRIGENVAAARAAAGLTLRAAGEAVESDFSALAHTEKGSRGVPRLSLVLRLSGSLNVRPGLIIAGIEWDSSADSFQMQEVTPAPDAAPVRLGENTRRVRYRLDLSQQALSDRASMSRGDLVDFENGSRNFRLFTVVRLAGALGIGFDELFAEVASWHIRPLPPPEFLPGEAPTKAERDELLIRLWSQGRGEKEIAEALDIAQASVGPYIRDLRDSGVQLAYRRPARCRNEQVARRRRRGHCDANLPPRRRA